MVLSFKLFFFFFNDTATTEIYTLSLHDALPISRSLCKADMVRVGVGQDHRVQVVQAMPERVERSQEQRPVTWRAGIDERQAAAGLFDQVEVGGCACDPMYPWGNFGWGRLRGVRHVSFLPWMLVA